MVYWDGGDSSAELVELVGSPSQLTQTTYTVSDAVIPGTVYRFKVQAINKWGEGPFSEVTSILAASKPATISPAAVTQVAQSTGDVVITWTEPDAHGSPLLQYLIQVKNSLGSWVSPTCNQVELVVFATRTCNVQMLSLS